MITIATILFLVLISAVIIFQLALIIGMPLGEYAMGGKFQGKLPFAMRVAAVIQILILFFFMIIVTTKSGWLFQQYYVYSKTAIWFVVAFSILATVLNLITPSKKERKIWAPVSIMLLICSVIIAIN